MRELEIYPFWEIKTFQRLVVRFVPDLNEDNNFNFIDSYHFHRVQIDGKPMAALCSTIHEDNQTCYHCVIAKRSFDKGGFGKDNVARTLWRKQQYIGNVIIIEDPLSITDPSNPKTYRLPMGKLLFNSLKNELTNSKIVKEIPSDYYKGNDFVITKEMHGQYPKYEGTFRRASRLSDENIKLAEESLINLSEIRPKLFSSKCNDDLSKDLMWEILGTE